MVLAICQHLFFIKKVRKQDMIKITFKNGNICTWGKDEYTDYKYDGKCLVIIFNGQWVGIYNIDSIVSVIVK